MTEITEDNEHNFICGLHKRMLTSEEVDEVERMCYRAGMTGANRHADRAGLAQVVQDKLVEFDRLIARREAAGWTTKTVDIYRFIIWNDWVENAELTRHYNVDGEALGRELSRLIDARMIIPAVERGKNYWRSRVDSWGDEREVVINRAEG